MSYLKSIFKKNKNWILLNIPAFIFVSLLIKDPKFWKPLTSWTAYSALTLFIILLLINPLRIHFPTSKILRELNKHRRIIGVASFNYALTHFICFAIKKGSIVATLKWMFHPVILPGLVALLVFIPLALTSNKFALKKMKFSKWKKLHNKVYIAEWGIFIHMIIRGGKTTIFALLLFIPLFTLQFIRRKNRKKKQK